MHIDPIIVRAELRQIFGRLFAIAPYELWKRRAHQLDLRVKQNPFLEDYLADRFSAELTLPAVVASYRARGRYPAVAGPMASRCYNLYSMASTLVRVYHRLSSKGQANLRGRLRAGLTTEEGLLPLAVELETAVHLWNARFDVDFTDLEGLAQFDMLARKDELEIEIDCKTLLGDRGRRVHRRRALELFHRIEPALATLLTRAGGHAVKIVVPDALDGSVAYMERVASLTIEAATAGADRSDSAASVSIVPFPLASGMFDHHRPASQEEIADLAARVLGSNNPQAIAAHEPGRAAVLIAVESAKPDQGARRVYDDLKDSAENQFSGNRAAVLAVRFTDVTSPQLAELGRDQNHGLAAITSRLFAGPSRAHLFGVAFLATAGAPTPMAALPGDPTVLQHQGTALMLWANAHPLASDRRMTGLFSAQRSAPRTAA